MKNQFHFLSEDEKVRNEAQKLIFKAVNFYDKLHIFREQRTRTRKFVGGDQWSDSMPDPNDETGSTQITEKKYLMESGRFPAVNNQMGTMLRNLIGQYRQNRPESLIVSRSRGKQKEAEMLTGALKYVKDLNRLTNLDASQLREFLISGATGWRVDFSWWDELDQSECKVMPIDQTRLFHNDVQDPRMFDLDFIGYLHDLTSDELISLFCQDKKDEKKLKERYFAGRETHDFDESTEDVAFQAETRDFYIESDLSKFRVVEVWTKKYSWVEVLHDPKTGDEKLYNGNEVELKALMELRELEAEYAGIEPEKLMPTISKKYEARYHVWFLTPYGDVLFHAPSPFWHGSHPFVIQKYPMIDGEVRGLMSDIIDQQKHINRNISIIDFMISLGAKGVLMVPKDVIPENESPETFAKKWRSFDDVIVYEPRPDKQMPQQISANSMPVGVIDMLNTQLQLMDKISGLNGAMQGQTPSSQTPASLYAQQTVNASLNNRDVFDVFNEAVKQRDKRIAQIVQQYWDEPKFVRVKSFTGYDEVDYDPERVQNFDFDTTMNESTASGLYRAMIDDRLNEWLMGGLIQLEDFLEMSAMPFADTLLEKIKARQQQLQEAQQAGQMLPAGQPQPQQIAQ